MVDKKDMGVNYVHELMTPIDYVSEGIGRGIGGLGQGLGYGFGALGQGVGNMWQGLGKLVSSPFTIIIIVIAGVFIVSRM